MPTKNTTGIRRTVTFTPWCSLCGWNGDPQEFKGDAAFFIARHNIDRHGGSARLGEES